MVVTGVVTGATVVGAVIVVPGAVTGAVIGVETGAGATDDIRAVPVVLRLVVPHRRWAWMAQAVAQYWVVNSPVRRTR